ncbi:protein kinase C-binding protein NELL2-like [Megalobrama amblycephala]|uniref:protein kinase C-binding protein NELL2-like n=1 Tax=Megalobrama amblycephala TaxID=75352 RepID=UPI002013E369|nr:protein kinase C-binding protein NELL2-like [Megalobrama amblycephala]
MGLLQLFVGLFYAAAVAAFGVDPAVRISVFQEFSPGEGFSGVTQVQGFHDDTRAFLFQGKTVGLKTNRNLGENMFLLGSALLAISQLTGNVLRTFWQGSEQTFFR